MPATVYLMVGPATHIRKILSEVPTLDFHVLTPWKRVARDGKLSETLEMMIIIIIITLVRTYTKISSNKSRTQDDYTLESASAK
jgi:hypothetical protein